MGPNKRNIQRIFVIFAAKLILWILLRIVLARLFLAVLKGSIFLKNRHFIVQERFNKLIYGINTIIKCGT